MPSARRPKSSTARGYGTEHQRRRRAALAAAYGTRCRRCGQLMLPGQQLDFGHPVDLAVDRTSRADVMEHASCNRSAGGALGSERAKYATTRSVRR